MPERKIPTKFEVSLYGDLERYTDTISKCRARIFYRGLNRNSSYITDEFAEKLIKTIPYAPVKGIWDDENLDYTDHGNGIKSLGKAYGVVPENNNGAWERHVDYDGIERTYYCCDVLLWTALYENAKKIPGKGQSMELYEPSIKGNWKENDQYYCYVFEEGSFLGLQVLGDEHEPCFEGSSFYSLNKDICDTLKEDFSEIIKVAKNYNLQTMEDKEMDENKVTQTIDATQTDDKSTEDIVNNELNDDQSVDNNAAAAGTEGEIQTEDTSVKDIEPENIEDKATDGETSIKGQEVQDYEKMYNELLVKHQELEEKFSKISNEKTVLEKEFEHIKVERDNLKEFKDKTDTAEKEKVIEKYSKALTEEIVNKYKEEMKNFTATELDKELCFEVHKNDSVVNDMASYSYKGESVEDKSEIQQYLDSYRTN